jgi:hypothetical protein
MKNPILRAAVVASFAAIMPVGAAATASELPVFAVTGFPISQHQVSVLGSAIIEEQAPPPALTLNGMPASPLQIAVLTPHPKRTAEITRAGFSTP